MDTHAKWQEVIIMGTTTADRMIEELHSLFSCYGLPEQVVTDNGPQFVTTKFSSFLKSNRIHPKVDKTISDKEALQN